MTMKKKNADAKPIVEESKIRFLELKSLNSTKHLYLMLEEKAVEKWRSEEVTALEFFKDVLGPYLVTESPRQKEGMDGSKAKAEVWGKMAEAGEEEILDLISRIAQHCKREGDRHLKIAKDSKQNADADKFKAYDLMWEYLSGVLDLYDYIL